MALSVLPVREWVVNAFPRSLKLATSAGIGLFLAIIAMRNAGLVEASEATLVTLGDVTAAPAVLAVVGLVLIAALEARRVTGGPIIGILTVTVIGLALGVTPFRGVVDVPPSIAPTLFVLDIGAALDIALFGVIFAFLFTDLFDTAGTPDRRGPTGRPARCRGAVAARQEGAGSGLDGHHGRRAARDVPGHQLHRERRRREGGRADGADGGDGGGAVPGDAVPVAAGRHDPGPTPPRRRCCSSPASWRAAWSTSTGRT